MTESKSILAQSIEKRPRKAYEVEVQHFFHLGGKEIHKVAIRVNTKKEQDTAIVSAHTRINQETGGIAESARSDDDLLLDAKTIEVLFSACRRCENGDKEEGYMYPAFPGPSWMRENMTTEQLAVLLNLYNEIRIKDGPLEQEITYDKVDLLASLCSDNFNSELPESILSAFSREWLAQAFVLLSKRLSDAKSESSSGISEEGTQETDEEAGPGSGDHGEGSSVSSGERESGASVSE